jgi:glycosyltransferase involved in cell wall biosynthesis
MRRLFLSSVYQRNHGFLFDTYNYVFKELQFECFYLDYKKYYKYLLKLLWKKYDLIWAESNARGFITILAKSAPLLRKRMTETAVITRFHRVPKMMFKERSWKSLVPLFASDLLVWVYNCRNELKELIPLFPQERFYVVHNGIDLDFYKPMANTAKNQNLILTLSSWWKHKRLELLIEAMKYLPNYELVIIGRFLDSEYKEHCLNLAKKFPRRISFIGEKYGKEKVYWMNKAGIFVLPSKLEAMSTQTMEAMACETPILITEGGGTNEYVPEKERLPKNITAKELAEKIYALSRNERIGKKNRESVAKYSWETVRTEVDLVLKMSVAVCGKAIREEEMLT